MQRRDWNSVVDELCECGHRKSVHQGMMHHLGCNKCPECSRYTWKKFIYRKKAAEPAAVRW